MPTACALSPRGDLLFGKVSQTKKQFKFKWFEIFRLPELFYVLFL
nr:hypothetical protein [Alysiella crassa]